MRKLQIEKAFYVRPAPFGKAKLQRCKQGLLVAEAPIKGADGVTRRGGDVGDVSLIIALACKYGVACPQETLLRQPTARLERGKDPVQSIQICKIRIHYDLQGSDRRGEVLQRGMLFGALPHDGAG